MKKQLKTKVEKLVKLFNVPRNKTQKLAFKYLFSSLSALEQIAVLAAERGAGVEGQLDDEIVHRETFKQLANLCGGYEEPCDYTQNLINYLESLEGERSIAALNVVAEGWLGCVFEGLSKTCPQLFDSIGEDEARHNGYALSFPVEKTPQLEFVVRNLEKLLLDIVKSPNFIIPMIYLIGMRDVGKMGLNILDSHERACRHLNVHSDTRDVRIFCKSTINASKNYPEQIEINNWQHNKLKIWKNNAQMVQLKEIMIDSPNRFVSQSKIIEAVNSVLKFYPNYKNVTRDGKIFKTKNPIVGVRVPWDEEQLTTIFLDSRGGHKKILQRMIRKTRKIRKKPFEKLLDVDHLKDLLPPSQCSVVVSFVGFHDPEDLSAWGWGVIDELEGIPITIFVCHPIKKEGNFWRTRIIILMDHRVHDGKDLSLFTNKLQKYLYENSTLQNV